MIERKTITVVLTEQEMEIAAGVGAARHAYAEARGYNPGLGPTSEEKHILGAQGEWACAIGLNLYWRPGDIHSKDVGGIAEVKTILALGHHLIVKPKAPDIDPYVLVLQSGRIHQLRGWITAGVAKTMTPLRQGPGDPGHWIKDGWLLDIYDLKRRLHYDLAVSTAEEHAA